MAAQHKGRGSAARPSRSGVQLVQAPRRRERVHEQLRGLHVLRNGSLRPSLRRSLRLAAVSKLFLLRRQGSEHPQQQDLILGLAEPSWLIHTPHECICAAGMAVAAPFWRKLAAPDL